MRLLVVMIGEEVVVAVKLGVAVEEVEDVA